MFKPLVCIFNQDKLIPIRYCPLQIKLELINNGADAAFVDLVIAGGKYTTHRGISDIQCKCDLLILDSSLDNEYASHILSGKPLPINFSTWNQTSQSTGNDNDFSTHINRSLTRLKSAFITSGNNESGRDKEVDIFYHPVASSTSDQYDLNDEHQVCIQIGSKLVPEYPITSVTGALYQLKKAVGTPFQMYARRYRTHKYINGFGLEKFSGAGFTGMNTKAGDLLTLSSRDCADGINGNIPTRVYCCLYYECVLKIKDPGVEMLG